MAELTASSILFSPGDELTSRRQLFPLNTVWTFYQANAPTGWTRSTAHNNKALRVVSGTGGGSGGSGSFTSIFSSIVIGGPLTSSGSTGPRVLSTPQIASHPHTNPGGVQLNAVPAIINPAGAQTGWNGGDVGRRPFGPNGGWSRTFPATGNTNSPARDQGHTHPYSASGTVPNQTLDINVQYIDIIICSFNG
jgi:hypothetical protein